VGINLLNLLNLINSSVLLVYAQKPIILPVNSPLFYGGNALFLLHHYKYS
jgi:hypothetical protein